MCRISLKEFKHFTDRDLLELFKYVYKRKLLNAEKFELEKFRAKTTMWCKNMNSEYFGIFYENVLVGTISLSKQNQKEKYASIGYEIFNKYRKQGFASKAFQLILKKASNKDLVTVKSKIPKDNEASIKIWKKEGAIFKEFDHEKFDVCINLNLIKT